VIISVVEGSRGKMDTRSELIEEIREYVARHGLDATVSRYAATLATWPGDPAGMWLRVSSGGQDEANQLPDMLTLCATQGYRPSRWYMLNDKSASKGEQQAHQDEAVSDTRDGAIRVLVCWHSDRLERRGVEALFKLLREVKDAGGQIRSTKEPLFGTDDITGESVTALGAIAAHQFTVHLSEQTRAGHARSRANGAMVAGGVPWGYETFGPRYDTGLRPTDLTIFNCGSY
jgi:DNA invertase Pin-like site-specific DNA recombinase